MINAIRPRAGRHPLRFRLATALTCMLATGIVVTTPHTASAVAAPVPLGAATNFAVLAASTVTNTGPSIITGDLGVSPGTAVTGFPPGVVIGGTVHSNDAAAIAAQAALTTAYNNAAGQPADATIPTELGGTTRTPGVYNSAAGTFGITGNLTLNAQGNPNAIFIFKAASTLITASGSTVTLIGGAQACNVFWQVGSSATLGTNSSFVGTILAQASITATTGVTVNGRLLARTAAVTLDTNTVTRPLCQVPPPGTTTMTLISSCPVRRGGPIVLVATVRSSNGTVPTGTVFFRDRGVVVGSAPLVASGVGTARATIAPNLPRDRTARITATYTGTLLVGPSTSNVLIQRVGEDGRCPSPRKHRPVNNTNNNNNAGPRA
ncbi:Ig-like domain (group 3) [Streptosporangium subroseum]|uniref:Ig-like domain (Group 3) n=1 Tax=Streptosporangium subroseum TaxID=106412 RepID=A0A239P121_9ACTN|nr:ice-binding family protein [Streptosporangium subroseum]SNT60796.1 Ig-like domain (group 3) [Streptosporangium subroseum]